MVISLICGEPASLEIGAIPAKAWWAFAYLAIVSSMVALTAYAWLLKNAPASKVATYSYVNPIIAVFLGWLILSEVINLQTALAVVVIVSGVVLIVTDKNKKKSNDSNQETCEPIKRSVRRIEKRKEQLCEMGG